MPSLPNEGKNPLFSYFYTFYVPKDLMKFRPKQSKYGISREVELHTICSYFPVRFSNLTEFSGSLIVCFIKKNPCMWIWNTVDKIFEEPKASLMLFGI